MNDSAEGAPFTSQQLWEQGWDGHTRDQFERLSRLPLSEKLLWLEEAHRLVLHLQRKSRSPKRED